MKVTSVLWRHNVIRTFRYIWRKKGKMKIPPLVIPPELSAMGVKIYDARDVAADRYDFNAGHSAMEVVSLSEEAGKKFYVFDNTVKVTEKETQVGALTKTLCYDGLPPLLSPLVGIEKIPKQDHLVQNAILQAIVRDGQLVKLPKKLDVTKPGWVWPREYGIRYKRKSYSLMERLSFLAEMGCGKYPHSLARWKTLEAYSEVLVERGVDTVIFKLLSDFLFTSDKPLNPFADTEEVEMTKDTQLPSIYPVKPTLDLIQMDHNPCENTEIDVLDADIARNQFIHTIHIIHKSIGFWFPVHNSSRAVASCFAFAAQEARMQYGRDVKELPRPISVQCIFSNLDSVGFVAYQLNTLDLSDDNGIKNIAWIDGPHKLYEEADEITEVKGYNSEIFPKILAMYLNGAHPSALY